MSYIFHYFIRTRHEISLERGGNSTSDHYENVVGGEISGTQAGTVYSSVTNVLELEMLLGAYFVQIGGTVNKLSAVHNLLLPLFLLVKKRTVTYLSFRSFYCSC